MVIICYECFSITIIQTIIEKTKHTILEGWQSNPFPSSKKTIAIPIQFFLNEFLLSRK